LIPSLILQVDKSLKYSNDKGNKENMQFHNQADTTTKIDALSPLTTRPYQDKNATIFHHHLFTSTEAGS
jgi:hypothetical protein